MDRLQSVRKPLAITVVDLGWHQTAYLIAEFDRAGVDTTLIVPASVVSGELKAYCRLVPSPDVDAPDYFQFVLDTLKGNPPQLILPTTEEVQRLLWDREAELPAPVFPSTDASQRLLLSDRCALYRAVAESGVPVPWYTVVHNPDAALAAAEACGLPCVVRGTQGQSGAQVMIAETREAVREAYQALAAVSPGAPFIQQYVEGQRCLVGGLFDGGRPLQLFAQTTLESSPSRTGPSIRVRSLRSDILDDYAGRIFAALGWDGLACAEFIRRPDGGFTFLEVNPRPWAAIGAAHDCGVPLLTSFAHYLQKRDVGPRRSYVGDRDCTLFPAFALARLRSGDYPAWRDLSAYFQMLRAVPLRNAALLRYYLRILVWTRASVKARASNLPPTPTPRDGMGRVEF